ncbi:Mitochondrial intermediate peptidase [Malassezia pachydermatis]|uniref:mitochondrial intermediate peptidase n=1 Tax=Malassezia pachydermatis TaxID=77020 RepID=A0A0M9VR87_9BASI|nr:mitochondrial intermediate peptidase [Malassezia pachydermatis]KOS16325.1 mitochondrial intermediate peptidase [Malassezia pachydermatis]
MARSDAAATAALQAGVAPQIERDHTILREILDAPPKPTASGTPTGLFQIDHLREPQDFLRLAERTLIRCQLLVERIARVASPDAEMAEVVRVVQNLDRLSDMLCGVIDMAELVRHAHPEPVWSEAANGAYEYLCNYMNVLNTHTGLYEALRRAMKDESVWRQLSEEAQAVALIFLRDFEKSGIHLPPQERDRFVQLSDEIMVLGHTFLQNMSHGTDEAPTQFPMELLEGLDTSVLKTHSQGFFHRASSLTVVPGSWELHYISKHAPDVRARRLAYEISYTGRTTPIEVLERLLRTRYELAKLTGKRSFADMALVDKMAGSPEHAEGFLRLVADAQRPAAERMVGELSKLKQQAEGTAPLEVWDREYYADQYLQLHRPVRPMPLSPYLSLGSVFTGLSRLFYLLYGIHFRAAEPQPGEVWRSDVVKLDVVDETEGGVIGTIYCDLFSRPGKPPSAAHYTVRCSRRIDWDDTQRDVTLGARPDFPRDVDMSHLLGVQGTTGRGREGQFQLPIVVLMTDFAAPTMGHDGASLLRWHDVETLFHEMGHAIHSMIGRTEYHNVSGTRCATDFVELPSILMEHFVSDPRIVQLTAHHYKSGAALPYQHLQAHLETQRHLDALDAHQQIMLATMDQRYHSARAGDPSFSTSLELELLQRQMGLFPPVPNSTWQGQFGHLFGYGATYYSYLFDRAIAARVWQKVFSAEPLSREAGEQFKQVLRRGGGKDPWTMLSRLLNDEQIAPGDAQAMETIGRWGLGEEAE